MSKTKILWGAVGMVMGIAASTWSADITWVSFHESDAPSGAAAGAGYENASDIGYTNLLMENGHNVTRFLTHEPLSGEDLGILNGSDLVVNQPFSEQRPLRSARRLEHPGNRPSDRDVRVHSSQQSPEPDGRNHHG